MHSLEPLLPLLMCSALAGSGTVLELPGTGSVGRAEASGSLSQKTPPLPDPCHTNPIYTATGIIYKMKACHNNSKALRILFTNRKKEKNQKRICEKKILALQKHENAGVPNIALAFLSSPRAKHRPMVLTAISILSA